MLLEVYKGIPRKLVNEDCCIFIMLLCECALELGDKTRRVGLELVYQNNSPWPGGCLRGTFVVSLDPPRSFCHFAILTSCTKGFLASEQAFGQLSLYRQLLDAFKRQMPKPIVPPQQFVMWVEQHQLLVFWDHMGDWAKIDESGLRYSSLRVIHVFVQFLMVIVLWWWLDWILWLERIIIVLVGDDVGREYVGLHGFGYVDSGTKGME